MYLPTICSALRQSAHQSRWTKAHPESTTDVFDDKVFINAQKSVKGKAELEQIRNIFIGILRDIRKSMEAGEPTSPTIVREAWQGMLDKLPKSSATGGEIPSADEMAEMIANTLGQAGILDASGVEMLQQVAKQMLEHSRRQT